MAPSPSLILGLSHSTGKVTATSCLQCYVKWFHVPNPFLLKPNVVQFNLCHISFKSSLSLTSHLAQAKRLTATSGTVTGHPESHPTISPTKSNHPQPTEESGTRQSTCFSKTQQSQTEFSMPIDGIVSSQYMASPALPWPLIGSVQQSNGSLS